MMINVASNASKLPTYVVNALSRRRFMKIYVCILHKEEYFMVTNGGDGPSPFKIMSATFLLAKFYF